MIKLKETIFSYSEAAKQSEAEFKRLWRHAFRGFKQMGLSVFWAPKTVLLSVDPDTKTAEIPEDIIQWIKVGQFNAAGELQTLRVNEQLTLFHDALPSRLSDIQPEIGDAAGALQSELWYNGFDGFTGGNQVGYGNQSPLAYGSKMIQYGECILDMAQRRIVLNPLYFWQEVVLEYVPSPEMDDDYSYPMQFEMAMMTWLGLWDIAFLPSTTHVGNNNIGMRMKMFKGQLGLAKRLFKPIRMQELWQELIEGQNMGIKP